jgi:sulfonate transport system substrate-binding protein
MISLTRFWSPIWRSLAAATLVAGALGAGSQARADDTHVLHIGYQKGTPLTLLKAQGVLDKALAAKNYTVSWIEFPAGPPLLEAMNAGAIDLGFTGAPPPIFAQSSGSRVAYLAAEPAGPHNEAIIVRADSPLKTIADLRGHTVAVTRGSGSHYLLVAALEKAGLTASDVRPVFLNPADARAAFENGKVDAWVIWDPYLAVVQQAIGTRTIADYADGIEQPYSFFLGFPEFLDAHPDIVQTVFREVLKNDVWVTQHLDETVKLVSQETGVPQSTVRFFFARSKFGLQPLTPAVIASQQRVADVFYQAKLIPHPVRIADAARPLAFEH